jgi:hypothetical protein
MKKLKLNPQLFEKVSTLIKTQCCNCYEENCLLLDDGDTHICPQLITQSHIICRYFLKSVLPGDKNLQKRITEL